MKRKFSKALSLALALVMALSLVALPSAFAADPSVVVSLVDASGDALTDVYAGTEGYLVLTIKDVATVTGVSVYGTVTGMELDKDNYDYSGVEALKYAGANATHSGKSQFAIAPGGDMSATVIDFSFANGIDEGLDTYTVNADLVVAKITVTFGAVGTTPTIAFTTFGYFANSSQKRLTSMVDGAVLPTFSALETKPVTITGAEWTDADGVAVTAPIETVEGVEVTDFSNFRIKATYDDSSSELLAITNGSVDENTKGAYISVDASTVTGVGEKKIDVTVVNPDSANKTLTVEDVITINVIAEVKPVITVPTEVVKVKIGETVNVPVTWTAGNKAYADAKITYTTSDATAVTVAPAEEAVDTTAASAADHTIAVTAANDETKADEYTIDVAINGTLATATITVKVTAEELTGAYTANVPVEGAAVVALYKNEIVKSNLTYDRVWSDGSATRTEAGIAVTDLSKLTFKKGDAVLTAADLAGETVEGVTVTYTDPDFDPTSEVAIDGLEEMIVTWENVTITVANEAEGKYSYGAAVIPGGMVLDGKAIAVAGTDAVAAVVDGELVITAPMTTVEATATIKGFTAVAVLVETVEDVTTVTINDAAYAGDMDANGAINVLDFYATAMAADGADYNGDTVVDDADIDVMFENYGISAGDPLPEAE